MRSFGLLLRFTGKAYCAGRRVEMEQRFPVAMRQGLAALGHQIDTLDGWSPSVGGGQGIRRRPDSGVLRGAADPRRDGYAVGF